MKKIFPLCAIFFLLFLTPIASASDNPNFYERITSLFSASIVQPTHIVKVYDFYNGKCGSGTSNSIMYVVDGTQRYYGTIMVPCSTPEQQSQYSKTKALEYANCCSPYNAYYYKGSLYQAPIYSWDAPTNSYNNDISAIGSNNINIITNTHTIIPFELTFPTQDETYANGNLSRSSYKFTVLDSFMRVIYDYSWYQIPSNRTSPVTVNFEFTPTWETIYYISGTVIQQTSIYSTTINTWTSSESLYSRKVVQVTSKASFATPTPTPTPSITVSNTPAVTVVPTPTIIYPKTLLDPDYIVIGGIFLIFIIVSMFFIKNNK